MFPDRLRSAFAARAIGLARTVAKNSCSYAETELQSARGGRKASGACAGECMQTSRGVCSSQQALVSPHYLTQSSPASMRQPFCAAADSAMYRANRRVAIAWPCRRSARTSRNPARRHHRGPEPGSGTP